MIILNNNKIHTYTIQRAILLALAFYSPRLLFGRGSSDVASAVVVVQLM